MTSNNNKVDTDSAEAPAQGVGCGALVRLKDTRITIGGVYRCCLATVAEEFGADGQVDIGAKSACRHCKEPFTLTAPTPSRKHATWLPDWQLKPNNRNLPADE